MKVVVVTNTDDHVIRMIDGSTSPLTEISLLSRRVLEFRDPADYITRVIISCDDQRNIRNAELPRCSNLCGKITHVATKDIYNPGIRPYIRRTKNLFGLFTCVYERTEKQTNVGAAVGDCSQMRPNHSLLQSPAPWEDAAPAGERERERDAAPAGVSTAV